GQRLRLRGCRTRRPPSPLRPAYSPSRRGAPRVPARGTTSPMGRRTGDLVVQPLSQAAHPVGEEAAELPRPRALRRGHHRVARTCGIGSKRCGETLGARNGAELRAILTRPTQDVARSKLLGRIERANDRMLGRRLRGLVLTMIDRAYHWGVTNLLR